MAMKATFEPTDPVPQLIDELVDGLHLLYECRRRGVGELDRLLEYLECKMDEIERERLGMSSELFITMMAADESDALKPQRSAKSSRVVPFPVSR